MRCINKKFLYSNSSIDFNSLSGNFKKYCNLAKSLSPEVASMISTGNFVGQYYGLASNTGYTISLQRTNVFQLAAQFTAVCKFSLDHYSKNMRKFYPESWGILLLFVFYVYIFLCFKRYILPFMMFHCNIL